MAEGEGERIYVRNEAGGLVPLMEKRFDKEDHLQKLLAEHPELLEGTQIQPDNPRRWILITREQGIAFTDDAAARWSLDVLVIDQDATPTLVEVKRGDNSQLRREVVGQMLDYAAHAHLVSVGKMSETFMKQPNAYERLCKLLDDPEPNVDQFWEAVAENFKDRTLRLLFVADAIPDELAHIVEFLNEKMPDIQVLAVEIKQFPGETTQTLVPRVIGRLAKSRAGSASGGSTRRQLTQDLLLEELPNDDVRAAAIRILNMAEEYDTDVHLEWGAASVAIRAISADGERNTIALIYRPSAGGREQHFVFGGWHSRLTGELRTFLDKWVNQIGSYEFTDFISTGRWGVSYDNAVANIDLLADRLRTALTEIPKLSNDG